MKLFIIHGWAYSIEPWQQTVEILKKQGIEVIQLKVPGLTSPSEAVWTIDEYVDWLDTELKHEESPIILGHSNGGRIAMHYAISHPGKIRQLILLNSAGIEIKSQNLSVKRKILKIMSKLFAPLKYIPGFRRIIYRLLGSDYGRAPKNMQTTLANMLASDRDFDPSLIDTRVDILWGESDPTTPLAMGKKLHQLIKDSSFKSIADWQHAPYRTHPAELAIEITAILEDGQ